MDTDGVGHRWREAVARLDATPVEVAGLAILLAGAVAALALLWWTGRPVPVPSPQLSGTATPAPGATPGLAPPAGEVTVHVAGSVGRPGLVRLPAGARVEDALAAAGGLRLDADPGALNLARPVTDGERIDVARIGDTATTTAPGGGPDGSGGRRPDGTLDLNRATATELEELPGVGPVLAGRVLAWRDEHGPFTEVGQLREVAGIGEKTFQTLAPLVAV